jgi:hypothetical protein
MSAFTVCSLLTTLCRALRCVFCRKHGDAVLWQGPCCTCDGSCDVRGVLQCRARRIAHTTVLHTAGACCYGWQRWDCLWREGIFSRCQQTVGGSMACWPEPLSHVGQLLTVQCWIPGLSLLPSLDLPNTLNHLTPVRPLQIQQGHHQLLSTAQAAATKLHTFGDSPSQHPPSL